MKNIAVIGSGYTGTEITKRMLTPILPNTNIEIINDDPTITYALINPSKLEIISKSGKELRRERRKLNRK